MVKNIPTNKRNYGHFFSENLKYLLKHFAVSQYELALFVERKQTTVSNWINGNSTPDVDDLVKIYHYFGIGIDALILMDISKSKLLTDKYAANFEKRHQTTKKEVGSRGSIPDGAIAKHMLQEPEPEFNGPVLQELRQLSAKLDSLKTITEKVLGKEKKKR